MRFQNTWKFIISGLCIAREWYGLETHYAIP